MSRKEKRNKRRKKNSKKNKYAHLSIASKSEMGTTEEVRPVNNNDLSSKFCAIDPGAKNKKMGNSFDQMNKSKLFLSEEVSNGSGSSKPKGKSFDKASGKTKKSLTNLKKKSLSESPHTPDKQKFNLSKLKEVLSTSEKKIKTITEELQKKSEKQKELILESTSPSKQLKEKAKKTTKENIVRKTPQKKAFEKNKQNVKGEKKDETVNEGKEKSLKERMQDQLNAARFRYLNEQLYTTTGSEAAELFVDDDDAFHVYHQGYQTQVSKWPIDPLSIIIKQIKARHKSPKTLIADMGCGSARLAQSLPGVKVHSFDFVAANDHVTACDMSDVPLEDDSVDVVVFCLSLMGTNLVDYILEANRILKTGGTMKIAEVESRFKKVGAFVSKVEKLGFEIVTKDLTNKMFYLFDFKKVNDVEGSASNPKIELDPCIYKKR